MGAFFAELHFRLHNPTFFGFGEKVDECQPEILYEFGVSSIFIHSLVHSFIHSFKNSNFHPGLHSMLDKVGEFLTGTKMK